MRKIVYTRPDGGVSVVHPVRNTYPRPETLTDAQIEQRAWNKLPPDAINPQFVEETAIPLDRTFRNAWKLGQGGVKVDMPKARELHRDRLRQMRKPKLEALDAAYLRADEVGDLLEKQRIAALKQTLRNVTADPAIEAALTPEQLKVVLPESLK